MTAIRSALGRADAAAMALADASLALFASGSSATVDRARIKVLAAQDDMRKLRKLLSGILEVKWCNGCGDGMPGVMMDKDGKPFSCPVCADRKAAEEIARIAGRVAEPKREFKK